MRRASTAIVGARSRSSWVRLAGESLCLALRPMRSRYRSLGPCPGCDAETSPSPPSYSFGLGRLPERRAERRRVGVEQRLPGRRRTARPTVGLVKARARARRDPGRPHRRGAPRSHRRSRRSAPAAFERSLPPLAAWDPQRAKRPSPQRRPFPRRARTEIVRLESHRPGPALSSLQPADFSGADRDRTDDL